MPGVAKRSSPSAGNNTSSRKQKKLRQVLKKEKLGKGDIPKELPKHFTVGGYSELFLDFYRDLGLSTPEAMVVFQHVRYWWDYDRLPYVSDTVIASKMGVTARQVRAYKTRLEDLGLLKRIQRFLTPEEEAKARAAIARGEEPFDDPHSPYLDYRPLMEALDKLKEATGLDPNPDVVPRRRKAIDPAEVYLAFDRDHPVYVGKVSTSRFPSLRDGMNVHASIPVNRDGDEGYLVGTLVWIPKKEEVTSTEIEGVESDNPPKSEEISSQVLGSMLPIPPEEGCATPERLRLSLPAGAGGGAVNGSGPSAPFGRAEAIDDISALREEGDSVRNRVRGLPNPPKPQEGSSEPLGSMLPSAPRSFVAGRAQEAKASSSLSFSLPSRKIENIKNEYKSKDHAKIGSGLTPLSLAGGEHSSERGVGVCGAAADHIPGTGTGRGTPQGSGRPPGGYDRVKYPPETRRGYTTCEGIPAIQGKDVLRLARGESLDSGREDMPRRNSAPEEVEDVEAEEGPTAPLTDPKGPSASQEATEKGSTEVRLNQASQAVVEAIRRGAETRAQKTTKKPTTPKASKAKPAKERVYKQKPSDLLPGSGGAYPQGVPAHIMAKIPALVREAEGVWRAKFRIHYPDIPVKPWEAKEKAMAKRLFLAFGEGVSGFPTHPAIGLIEFAVSHYDKLTIGSKREQYPLPSLNYILAWWLQLMGANSALIRYKRAIEARSKQAPRPPFAEVTKEEREEEAQFEELERKVRRLGLL